jgi:hypothetical protein
MPLSCKSASALLIGLGLLVAGCGAPVYIGREQARAAGADVSRPQRQTMPAAVTSIPAQPGGSSGGPAFRSTLPQPSGQDEIAALGIQTGGARAAMFAVAFAPGQVPQGGGLVARANGHDVPTQIDVEARYPDASIKLAEVTLMVSATTDVMLMRRRAN